ncbi:MAG: hypothetical protein F7C09_07090 [Aeropyrum sp.]|nr:hypothetical protein [Aeropyrum sp.]
MEEGLRIDFSKGEGLVPVVVLDAVSGEVLMLGYADETALRLTLETGYAHFFSRSRRKVWMKGETSGNRVRVLRVVRDCDSDSLTYLGVAEGPVCHTGKYSCFYNTVMDRLVEEMWRHIVDAFRQAVITVRKGYGGLKDYVYIVNPLSDNIPPPNPLLQSLIATYLSSKIPGKIDKVVAPEALGLPIASLIAQKLRAPLAVVRKRRFPVPGWEAPFTSGYEDGIHYIYGVREGEKVVLADDTVSTGGAAISIIEALEGRGVKVKAVVASMAKPQYGGVDLLAERGLPVWRAVDVYVSHEGSVRLVQPEAGWEATLKVTVRNFKDLQK